MNLTAPAPRPCNSCPYRCDVPSGVWAVEEYERLPLYDLPTAEQSPSAFGCHQQDGRLCAGWVAVHDMEQNLGLRLAVSYGIIDPNEIEAIHIYTTDVPLFNSGAEAMAHGLAQVAAPNATAIRMILRLKQKANRCLTVP